MRSVTPLVLLAAAVVLFARLGARPVTDSAEERVVDVAAHMVESGDWIVPVREGEIRLRKPPLAYWLAAAGQSLVTDPLEGSRLPSAVCALLLLLLTAAWAARVAPPPAAPLAALLLLAMLLFEKEGRRATMEMPLALGCTAALFVFATRRPLGGSALVAFAAAAAFAFLAKGTPVLLVVALPLVLTALFDPARRGDALRALAALPVALLPTVAWYGALASRVPGGLERVARIALLPLGFGGGQADGATHYEPPWWYVEKLVGSSFPAALLLPILAWRAHRTRLWRENPSLRFLATVFLAGFVGFSLVPQKQKHYLLPLLPALAILTAEATLAALQARPRTVRRATRLLGALALLSCAFGAVVFFGYLDVAVGSRAGAIALAIASAAWILLAAKAVSSGDPARAARWVVPLVLLLLAARLAFLEVWRDQVKDAYDHGRPLPRQRVLLELHERGSPWLNLLGVEKKVRRTARRLADRRRNGPAPSK